MEDETVAYKQWVYSAFQGRCLENLSGCVDISGLDGGPFEVQSHDPLLPNTSALWRARLPNQSP